MKPHPEPLHGPLVVYYQELDVADESDKSSRPDLTGESSKPLGPDVVGDRQTLTTNISESVGKSQIQKPVETITLRHQEPIPQA